MNKSKLVLLAATFMFLGWMLLFQGTQPASSSPLLGITLTPTRQVPQITITSTVVVPTSLPTILAPTAAAPTAAAPTVVTPTKTPVVATLPPPSQPQSTPVIIPITGSDHSVNMNGLVNLGLLFLALGLIMVGLISRKR